jgi:D-beta-D-heptose 7-phosphate kinase/D-beta-D-heptose 1-phosphate adenosyltransferase
MIISYNDLEKIRLENKDKKIVLVTGSFDILHAGHILFFEDAKNQGDILIAAVGEDKALKLKGENRPILNQFIRVKMVDSLKPVDYAFIHDAAPEGSEFDNSFLPRIMELLHPDIWIVNKDASEIEYRQDLANKFNVDLKIFDRTAPAEYEEISTTKIIKKIQGLI